MILKRLKAFTILAFLLAVSGLLLVSNDASAATIRVSQESAAGAGDFDANILGFIDPFSTPLTISDFYQ